MFIISLFFSLLSFFCLFIILFQYFFGVFTFLLVFFSFILMLSMFFSSFFFFLFMWHSPVLHVAGYKSSSSLGFLNSAKIGINAVCGVNEFCLRVSMPGPCICKQTLAVELFWNNFICLFIRIARLHCHRLWSPKTIYHHNVHTWLDSCPNQWPPYF